MLPSPIRPGLRQTHTKRASLLVDNPDTTISTGLGDNQSRLLRIHSAARHAPRKIAPFTREPSNNLPIIFDEHFQVSRKEAQLRPEASDFRLVSPKPPNFPKKDAANDTGPPAPC